MSDLAAVAAAQEPGLFYALQDRPRRPVDPAPKDGDAADRAPSPPAPEAEGRLTLTDLLTDPAKGLDVAPREAATMLLALAPVVKALELAAGKVVAPRRDGRDTEPGDRLLNAEQVGERLGLSVRQVYRRARRWPFTRRPSEGTLRFSERGVEQFAAGKKAG